MKLSPQKTETQKREGLITLGLVAVAVLSALLVLTFVPAFAAPAPGGIYVVKKGDSLSLISLNKFSEMEKWHELWKLNDDHIKNPHLIYPGQKIRLLSGAQIDFFENRVASNGKKLPKMRGRSEEWRLLPSQNWEEFTFPDTPEVDPLGFDKRSKASKRFVNKTIIDATIATDRLAIQGEILHARSEFQHIFLGDQVFVRADEAMQVGNIYTVTPGPEKVRSTRDGRVGFIYPIYGKIKIIGVRDGTFIGTIIDMQHPIARKSLLIPEVQQTTFKKAIPAPSTIVASVIMGEATQNDILGENRTIFLDVGTQDQVQPGMVFRNYLHEDPYTKNEISTKDYLIEAEMVVLEVKEQFSLAMIVTSKTPLKANAEVVALTDLTDFNHHMGMQTSIENNKPVSQPDELDALDPGQGLGEAEDHELRQLETWNKTDDIKKENVHPEKTINGIGSEPAPNDQSGQVPNSPNNTEPPATAPEPAPITDQAPPVDAPPVDAPPVEAAPPAPPSAPPAAEPAPIMEAPPAPMENIPPPPPGLEGLDAPAAAPAPQAPAPNKPAVGPVPGAPKDAIPAPPAQN